MEADIKLDFLGQHTQTRPWELNPAFNPVLKPHHTIKTGQRFVAALLRPKSDGDFIDDLID